jgi:hypothetical protein
MAAMTDNELRSYAMKHLYYELWMLQEAAKRLLHDGNVHRDRVVKNAMVESTCVHARALAAFLYPEKFARRDGDVTAEHYIVDLATWTRERQDMPPILVLVKERAGKEIAHLTSDRKEYDDPDKEWPLQEIVNTIQAKFRLFVKHTPGARLDALIVGYIVGLQPPMEQSRVVVYAVGSTSISTASGPSSPGRS